MASQSSAISIRNQILLEYAVNDEQEADQMIRYTKVFTPELVFAVDLMTFVMSESNLRFQNYIYPNCFGKRGPSNFNDVMRKFVGLILTTKVKAKATIFMERNLNLYRIGYEEFKSFVNASAIKQGEMPYGEYGYLVFCVMMAEMCTIAFLHGIAKAPEFGVMLMCRTYSNFLINSSLPPDPWEVIEYVAREAVVLLEMGARRSDQ